MTSVIAPFAVPCFSDCSEGDHALEHEAVELAAVPDVGREEAFVLLRHVFAFQHERGGDEPASAALRATHRLLRIRQCELAVDGVVAAAYPELFAGAEAIHR